MSATPNGRGLRSDRRRNFIKANVEYRIMNIECRRNLSCLICKMIERSNSTIRQSTFVIPM
ncbi:hypothetical protein D1AOALGA4SA_9859 [Olavius algarvensis Delta 1 endosymbiont]|nr:hypothetical protein D1AOALGA4SA_9859 [Olavius algarvensis Delta 1 endosymbiont]